MRFQDAVRAHLVEYKHRVLQITEPGVFTHRGRVVHHDHVLPAERQDENLLPAARQLWPALARRCPGLTRHRHFHHLNSSQALAFNLFTPFFEAGAGAASLLLAALATPGRLARWEPEWVPDPVETTNFDAAWWLEDGTSVLCEVKYSEAGFGKAKSDRRHKDKLRDTYSGPLAPWVNKSALEEVVFFGHYQLLRNIWHMVQDDRRRLVILMPRGNTVLWKEWDRLAPMVSVSVRDRVTLVALEDVVRGLERAASLEESLQAHVRSFREKYLLVDSATAPIPTTQRP